MSEKEIIAHMALTHVPHIGDVQIGCLLKNFNTAEEVFKSSKKHLEQIQGIGEIRARSIKNFSGLAKVYDAYNYAMKNKIHVIVKGMDEYPRRLEQCIDAPHVIYFKGNVDLNAKRTVSIVGTRAPTEYGKECVVELMSTLSGKNVQVISGLAYGIDTIAHREALKQRLATIAVLGHGFNFIYPHSNRQMAAEIMMNGGLLTEFTHMVKPDRQNFPRRNRIVAGISDVVVVVESGEKGGSLITADIANSYNRDVLAFPGRAVDVQSMGCNQLIRLNRANLITNGDDVLNFMNWNDEGKMKNVKVQQELFLELDPSERKLYDLLVLQSPMHVDEISGLMQMKPSQVSGILLSLEMKNLLRPYPGSAYGISSH